METGINLKQTILQNMAKYSMYRGDYRELSATVTAPYNAGSRLLFGVKTKASAPLLDADDLNAIFTVDVAGTSAIDNGNGTLTFPIIITEDKTEDAIPNTYYAQVRYIDPNGRPTSYTPFEFIILPDYNQRA